MKKIFLSLVFIIATIISIAQNNVVSDTYEPIFCGKSGGEYTIAELKNCDWTIVVSDESFVVSSFQLALISKSSGLINDYKIKGNKISHEAKNNILNNQKRFYVEAINAKNSEGKEIMLRPLVVKIIP
jgi:hypothetical protein